MEVCSIHSGKFLSGSFSAIVWETNWIFDGLGAALANYRPATAMAFRWEDTGDQIFWLRSVVCKAVTVSWSRDRAQTLKIHMQR